MWLGEIRILPSKCTWHFWQHVGNINGKMVRMAWWTSWAFVVWTIWNHKNDIIFNQAS